MDISVLQSSLTVSPLVVRHSGQFQYNSSNTSVPVLRVDVGIDAISSST